MHNNSTLNRINSSTGFTLVELLVTIAIVGILSSIAVPQFNDYKKKAYDVATMSDIVNGTRALTLRMIDEDSVSANCKGANACLTEFAAEGLKLSGSTTNFSAIYNPNNGISVYAASCKGSMRNSSVAKGYGIDGVGAKLRETFYPWEINDVAKWVTDTDCS